MSIILIRSFILYISLMLLMRFLGKRQLGELELSEFVVAAVIADVSANPLQDIGMPLLNAIVPMVTLFCCEIIVSGLALKSVRLRELMFGRPSLLIEDGRIIQSELKKNRFTVDELMQELRSQGVSDIGTVEYAFLETDGSLSILQYAGERAVTANQLGIACTDGGYPKIVISDGRVISENLKKAGYSEAWLQRQLDTRRLEKEQVFLLTVDKSGKVYCVRRDGE